MSQTAIEIKNLSKKYRIDHYGKNKQNTIWDSISSRIRKPSTLISGEKAEQESFWALKNIDFKIAKGDVVGVVGSNGSGKSTLLKILSQIVEPTTGTIKMNGRVASLLEVGTGFHPELTGRENIYFNGSILGMSRKEINLKFKDIVEFSEIEKFLDTPVKFYSSGMYVRLAFAVAAHLDPEILIVDEVLAVGDAAFQKKSLGKMKDVAGQGRTVIFVSHSMSAVKQLCNTAIYLEKGEILFTGPSKKVSEFYLERTLKLTSTMPNIKINNDPNKTAQFTEFSIFNGKNVKTSQIKPDESWSVKIDYKIKQSCPKSLVGLEIIDPEGQVIFMSTNADILPKLKNIEIGKYSSSINLKGLSLNPGNYYFRVSIQSPGKHLYDSLESVPFMVTPLPNDVRESYFNGKYMGYISTKFNWETVKENE